MSEILIKKGIDEIIDMATPKDDSLSSDAVLAEVRKEDYIGKQEDWAQMWRCPVCEEIYIQREYNWCPFCGVKLDWKHFA